MCPPTRGLTRMRTPSATSPTSSPPTVRSTTLSVRVDGEVETQNTDGVVRGTVERFPPSLFLRDTALTQADERIREFAGESAPASGGDVLAQLHALMHRLHEEHAA